MSAAHHLGISQSRTIAGKQEPPAKTRRRFTCFTSASSVWRRSTLPDRVQRGLEFVFLLQADKFLRDLTVLEEDYRRDRVDAVLHRDLAVGVGVHLADLHLPGVVLR